VHARTSPKPHDQISPNLLRVLPVAVTRSSSGVIAIRYVLPVRPCCVAIGCVLFYTTARENKLDESIVHVVLRAKSVMHYAWCYTDLVEWLADAVARTASRQNHSRLR